MQNQTVSLLLTRSEVWKISDSPYAPRFYIIAKPNDWAKAVKKSTAHSELSATKLLQLEFWTKFKEYVQDKNGNIKLRKVYPQHWYDISFGFSNAHIALTVNTQSDKMACEVYITDSTQLFPALYKYKNQIEEELGEDLKWDELPTKKASRILLITEGNLSDQENWEQYHSWMLARATNFQKVFGKYIKKCAN